MFKTNISQPLASQYKCKRIQHFTLLLSFPQLGLQGILKRTSNGCNMYKHAISHANLSLRYFFFLYWLLYLFIHSFSCCWPCWKTQIQPPPRLEWECVLGLEPYPHGPSSLLLSPSSEGALGTHPRKASLLAAILPARCRLESQAVLGVRFRQVGRKCGWVRGSIERAGNRGNAIAGANKQQQLEKNKGVKGEENGVVGGERRHCSRSSNKTHPRRPPPSQDQLLSLRRFPRGSLIAGLDAQFQLCECALPLISLLLLL